MDQFNHNAMRTHVFDWLKTEAKSRNNDLTAAEGELCEQSGMPSDELQKVLEGALFSPESYQKLENFFTMTFSAPTNEPASVTTPEPLVESAKFALTMPSAAQMLAQKIVKPLPSTPSQKNITIGEQVDVARRAYRLLAGRALTKEMSDACRLPLNILELFQKPDAHHDQKLELRHFIDMDDALFHFESGIRAFPRYSPAKSLNALNVIDAPKQISVRERGIIRAAFPELDTQVMLSEIDRMQNRFRRMRPEVKDTAIGKSKICHTEYNAVTNALEMLHDKIPALNSLSSDNPEFQKTLLDIRGAMRTLDHFDTLKPETLESKVAWSKADKELLFRHKVAVRSFYEHTLLKVLPLKAFDCCLEQLKALAQEQALQRQPGGVLG